MSDHPTAVTIGLESWQVSLLMPMLERRTGNVVIVAAIHPDTAPGQVRWLLDVRMLPGSRRDAIKAACRGDLALPTAKRKLRVKAKQDACEE